MTTRRALSVLAATLAACHAEPGQEVVKGTAAERGEALFHDPKIAGTAENAYACATCHEATRGEAGNRILPGGPLAGAVARTSYWGGQENDLLRSVNACLYNFMLHNPWTREDRDAQDIYAYLESLPQAAVDVAPYAFTPVYAVAHPPKGDASHGAGVYDRACASCHGQAHTGGGRLVAFAPVLPEQTLSEHPAPKYSDADRRLVFVEKVRHGAFVGYGGEMPPFSAEVLPEQDFADLLSFLGLEAP